MKWDDRYSEGYGRGREVWLGSTAYLPGEYKFEIFKNYNGAVGYTYDVILYWDRSFLTRSYKRYKTVTSAKKSALDLLRKYIRERQARHRREMRALRNALRSTEKRKRAVHTDTKVVYKGS